MRTRPSPDTGSKSSGGRGRRFVGRVLSPGSSSPSARSSADDIPMRGLRSHLGGRRMPSKRGKLIGVLGQTQCLLGS